MKLGNSQRARKARAKTRGRRNAAHSLWELTKTAMLKYYCCERKISSSGIELRNSCVLTTSSLHNTSEATYEIYESKFDFHETLEGRSACLVYYSVTWRATFEIWFFLTNGILVDLLVNIEYWDDQLWTWWSGGRKFEDSVVAKVFLS